MKMSAKPSPFKRDEHYTSKRVITVDVFTQELFAQNLSLKEDNLGNTLSKCMQKSVGIGGLCRARRNKKF